MGDVFTGLIQNLGVIGTILLVVIVGMMVTRKVLDSWKLFALFLFALFLYMKNPDFLSDFPALGEIGTVKDIASAHSGNEEKYQQCLASSIASELPSNIRLRRGWDGCRTQYEKEFESCVLEAKKDPLIIDKQTYCWKNVLRSHWTPCVEDAIRRHSPSGDIHVQTCLNKYNIGNLRGPAGVISGQADDSGPGLIEKIKKWISSR